MTTLNITPKSAQRFPFYRIPSNLLQFANDPFKTVCQLCDETDDILEIRLGGYRHYMITDPDILHQVLVTQADKFGKHRTLRKSVRGVSSVMGRTLLNSDGDYWRRQRKLLSPAFHTQRIAAYADGIVSAAQEQLSDWESGQIRELDDEVSRIMLRTASKTLFDFDDTSATERIVEATELSRRAGNAIAYLLGLLPPWVPLPPNRNVQFSKATMDEILYALIQKRRKDDVRDKGDILSILLSAVDDENGHMTDKQIRDEAVTLFVVSYETASNALMWALYLLSVNPDKLRKLQSEVDAVLANRAATYEDYRCLPYTEMVIKEALRLYPPGWGLVREAKENVTINGYRIEAGSAVTSVLYHMHRDARWFDNSNDFIPERFAPDAPPVHKQAYIPFGDGPRVCIGSHFAMLNLVLVLATMARDYEFQLQSENAGAIAAEATLAPVHGSLRAKVIRRSSST